MQAYLVRRQEESQRNEPERRATLDRTAAIQKMNAQLCPGCERSIPEALDGVLVNHCVHCGLPLFNRCTQPLPDNSLCNVRKNAFYAHCPSCGQSAGHA